MSMLSALVAPLMKSLRWRLALSIALVHAVMMAVFVFDLVERERATFQQQARDSALQNATVLALTSHEWLLARDLAGLSELVTPFRQARDMKFVMIVAPDGQVLAHTDPERIGLYLRDPVSVAMLKDARLQPYLIQQSNLLLDAAAPIEHQGKPIGWVRVAMGAESAQDALDGSLRDGLLYTLAAILVGALLAILIAGGMTRDLRRVQELMRKVAQGELHHRIGLARLDEVGDVARGFDHMLDRLEHDDQLIKQTSERLELALRGSNDGLWDWDLSTNHVFYSPRWKAMLGYADAEIGNQKSEWAERVHPDDMAQIQRDLQAHLSGETPSYENIHRMRHKDGAWRWILDRGMVIRDAHGEPYRMVGTHTDLTELKEAEARLALERARLHNLLQTLHMGVLVETAGREIALANSGFCELFQAPRPPHELIGMDCRTLGQQLAPLFADPAGAWQRIQHLVATGEPVVGDIIQMRDGRTLERDYSPIMVENRLEGHLWMYRDITPRIRLEQTLREQRERLREILVSMADGVIVTDADGRIEFLNPAAVRLTGMPLERALGQPIESVARLIESETGRWLDHTLIESMMREGNRGIPARLVQEGDIQVIFDLELSAANLGERHTGGLVLILHDVSETHRLIEQISWQARHDPLTGLPNRADFSERLKHLLADVREHGGQHILLYMDLDQFKVVNDTCGHAAGDELLMSLAHILSEGTRRDDTIARLGGDEFGGLLPRCTIDDAMRIAQELRESVQAFSFYWQDRVFNVGVSIGIVAITTDWDSADDILRAADIACYAAKEEGRNRVHVYQTTDEAMSQRVEQLGMAAQIQLALHEERFVLYAQPLKPLGMIDDALHLEVLVRMVDREGKIMAPGLFISAAERYNHMQAIDRWVVNATLQRLHEVLTQPAPPPLRHIGINLSGHSLTHEAMLEFIENELRRYAFPHGLICFEITETAIISNLSQALTFIQRMKALGCTFALDDFGSGLSSFAYLKSLPVDYLKIDGVFVRDIVSDAHDRTFVQAINQVGHTLGLKTIAEFVENAATEGMLAEMGVDFAQGYGISAPKPLESFLGMDRERSA